MSGNATFRRIICYSAVLDAIPSTSASAHAVITRRDRWLSAGTVCDFTEASVWRHITCTEWLFFFINSSAIVKKDLEFKTIPRRNLFSGDLQKHLDANDVGLSAIQGWITLLMFLYNNSSTTPKIIRHPWRNLEDQAEIFQKAKHLFSISSSWNIIFYEENKFKLKRESHEIVCVCVCVFLLLFFKSVMSSKC